MVNVGAARSTRYSRRAINQHAFVDLRALRKGLKMAQAALSRQADIPIALLTRIERGLVQPTPEHAARLASVLGVELPAVSAWDMPVAGEGYVTSSSADGVVIRRRYEADIALRPVWDLFCGTGGFSAGFEATGAFKVVTGLDLLGDRLHTLTENHGAANAYGDDIRNIQTETLLEENPRPFVVIGGPPC